MGESESKRELVLTLVPIITEEIVCERKFVRVKQNERESYNEIVCLCVSMCVQDSERQIETVIVRERMCVNVRENEKC